MPSDRSGPDWGSDWGVGNYERTAQLLLPVAPSLVNATDLRTGERVLDLGKAALETPRCSQPPQAPMSSPWIHQSVYSAWRRNQQRNRNLDLTYLVSDAAHLGAGSPRSPTSWPPSSRPPSQMFVADRCRPPSAGYRAYCIVI